MYFTAVSLFSSASTDLKRLSDFKKSINDFNVPHRRSQTPETNVNKKQANNNGSGGSTSSTGSTTTTTTNGNANTIANSIHQEVISVLRDSTTINHQNIKSFTNKLNTITNKITKCKYPFLLVLFLKLKKMQTFWHQKIQFAQKNQKF
jgi:hypothetical protein